MSYFVKEMRTLKEAKLLKEPIVNLKHNKKNKIPTAIKCFYLVQLHLINKLIVKNTVQQNSRMLCT